MVRKALPRSAPAQPEVLASLVWRIESVLKRVAFCVGAIALVVACSTPKVDTSTDDSMKKSIERVRGSLPEEKRADFDQAVRSLAFASLNLQDIMAHGANTSTYTLVSKMKETLNGKTGDQILSEATKLREERERKERKQAVGEIAELQKKAGEAALAKQKLAGFTVTRSRFHQDKIGFMTLRVIELSVRNGTQVPVSRAYFHGVVASPGRSVPWISHDFQYSIPGGLEPGESANWKIYVSNGWQADAPIDAVLTIKVVKLDGADGKTLYDAEGLSDTDQQRLLALQTKYSIH
jgi:hypothetical protein